MSDKFSDTQDVKEKVTETMGGRKHGTFYSFSVIFLALGFSFLHMYHVSTLFENDRHFSHLSNLEREMTFRTEMGFYYYFYKVIINADSFEEGLDQLLQDNKTQYPEIINAINRFNLYPEDIFVLCYFFLNGFKTMPIKYLSTHSKPNKMKFLLNWPIMIGSLFRVFDSTTKYYGYTTKQCWQVNRGSSLPPVESCEGLGDSVYFYLEFVWYCAGLSKAVLFIYAVFMSESLSGGLLTILSFLYNHSHCTRVQWTPPLRESFAYPFCLLQMLTVSHCLKKSSTDKTINTFQVWSMATATMASLVLWQFSQFVIATQTVSILLLFCLGIIHKNTAVYIMFSQLVGLLQAAFVLFGNELLFQSILFSLILSTLIVIVSCGDRLPLFSSRGILLFGAVIVTALTLKTEINHFFGYHDAHIFDILRSKLTNFKNFHTQLYVCSPEFDFLPISTVYDVTKTGLVPLAVLVILLIFYKWGKNCYLWKKKMLKTERCIEPDIAYNVLQLGAFTVMAAFIMRLKLFWTPHLCLMASLIMSSKYLPARNNSRFTLLALIIAIMSYEGIYNLIKQRNIIGEYANIPFEEVLNWINSETLVTDVFAGPMSIMANVLLSTGRTIVNHPHYEHPSVRDRTMLVYSIFSRQTAEQVYSRLISMGVNYVILDESWCFPRNRENCSMVDLWDMIDPTNAGQEALCPKLFNGDSSPFVRAFSNDIYVILSLKSRQFIEITPLQQYQI